MPNCVVRTAAIRSMPETWTSSPGPASTSKPTRIGTSPPSWCQANQALLRAALRQPVPIRPKERLPPFGEAALRRLQREPMPSSVLARDAVPAKVFHRHARLATDGLEVNVHLSHLMEFEAGLPPAEDQARRALPDANASNLEYFAIGQPLYEATAWPRLEGQRSRASRRDLKQHILLPPLSTGLAEQVARA